MLQTPTEQSVDSLPFISIDSNSRLEQCVQKWLHEPYIILDTEFERSATFFAIPGLVQVAAAGKTYLIDPLQVSSLKPLAPLFESPDVAVVLHSMSEDIDLLGHVCECSFQRVFDTQIAMAFLGMGISVGYQRLVSMVLDIELDKGETRSDWLKRPLSKKQLHYASADVYYLEKIYKILLEKIEHTPWRQAVEEECMRQVRAIENANAHPDLAYLKLRGAWDLAAEKQRVLQQLVQWRDATAIKENIPKSWVFSDAHLIEAARTTPRNQSALFSLPKAKPKSVKRFGRTLLELLEHAEQGTTKAFKLVDRPIKGKELELYKRLKQTVNAAANQANIDPQLIAGRKQIESWVIHYWREGQRDVPELIQGWRKPLLEEGLDQLVATMKPVAAGSLS